MEGVKSKVDNFVHDTIIRQESNTIILYFLYIFSVHEHEIIRVNLMSVLVLPLGARHKTKIQEIK